MEDLFGKALLDFYHGNYTEDIITETNISEKDEFPLPYLFRSYKEMPKVEQKALNLARGKVLDIGCGSGSHALYLQEKGLDVTAIDTSPGAVEVAKKRGVKKVLLTDILAYSESSFDTILVLMNGTGIFKKVALVPRYLQHLKSLLTPKGSIYIDSSDISYMYDENDDGSIWVPSDRYYGELDFTMHYNGKRTQEFPWLYLDQNLFARICKENGFNFEILLEKPEHSYLCRLFY
ncbi:class I SAM-dependent methyltransferase [Jejudonia soesokkakensis]|uniref:Class I SAM-dependent methyltransferase n=1 Tax=Jejudonia soesokkakensis TaxID=1323432 RepID=A0ABW2MW60_9FLAO